MKYLAFFGAAAFALTGCENPTVEETLPYYYTETIAYLPDTGTQSVEFAHTPNGIQEKEIIFKVARKVNGDAKSELKKACTVTLDAAVDGIDPRYVTFRDGLTLTIPAGETEVSSAILIDWSFAAETETALACSIDLTLTGASVYPSTERNKMTFAITKGVLSYFYTTEPTSGSSISDRSGWTVSVTNNQSLTTWQTTTSLTDGASSYYFPGGTFIGVMVDLGEMKNLTGISSYSAYGSSYAPSSIIVETSVDGTEWTAVGPETAVTRAYYTYASFYNPIAARYFRLQLKGSGVLTSEIYAYAE